MIRGYCIDVTLGSWWSLKALVLGCVVCTIPGEIIKASSHPIGIDFKKPA